jgi:2-polyprenyl-6-methoxyphenol hydroxylase-like FAD-dependent oxidoreductase
MADILIVGAGPTGLTMAAVLARHGLRPRIIDRAVEPPADRSRAIVIQARTLELFEDLGIVSDVLGEALVVDEVNFYSPSGRHGTLRIDPRWIDSRYGRIVSLPQDRTEAILTDLVSRSGIQVEHGVELVGLADRGSAAEAVLRHADGRQDRVTVDWVLGCDGLHSAVREAVGIPFVGSTYPDEGLLGDVQISWSLPDGQLAICPGETGVLLAFPLPGARHFRVILIEPATGGENARDLSEQEFLGEVSSALPRAPHAAPPELLTTHWLTRYRLHRKGAPTYRKGRAFVAGDAAHIHSPVGAQGMNTGIQDAYNLGWKVALVARGEAPPSLLDSYDAERRPVGEKLLHVTDRFFAIAVGGGRFGRAVRRLLPTIAVRVLQLPVVRKRLARFVSQTGIRYRGSPLSVDAHGAARLDARAPHAGDRAPDVELGPSRWLGELLHGPRHTLLLFAGRSTALLERFSTMSDEATTKYGSLVAPVILRLDPAHPAIGEVDRRGLAHARYGAEREGAIYLVRPDGYIAFRGAGTDVEVLRATLRQRFIVNTPTRD